jgi:hypothetical protein
VSNNNSLYNNFIRDKMEEIINFITDKADKSAEFSDLDTSALNDDGKRFATLGYCMNELREGAEINMKLAAIGVSLHMTGDTSKTWQMVLDVMKDAREDAAKGKQS